MNLQAQANAMFKAAEEFKNVKRNKSGSVNETSKHAIKKRLVAVLIAEGEESYNAWNMAHELANEIIK